MDLSGHHRGMRRPIRVMLVDDDLIVRTIVRSLLAKHAELLVTGVFETGSEAITAVSADPPDVMVVDISMPVMDGVELTKRVLAAHPKVRILAYTSLADEQSLSAMLSAGAAGVVYKEASVSAVADAIRTTYAGLSVLSPRFSSRLARSGPTESLSDTEREVLRLVSRGMTNEEIGSEINLAASTIKYHITKLTEKLGATNRVTLAVAAVRLGLDRDQPTGSDPH